MDNTDLRRRSIGARPNPETAEAILDAAAAILTKSGLKGLTTDAIAREAHASKTTLYRWWPNRGALLLALYMRMKGDHAHADTGALVDDIAVFYRQIFAFWRGDGHVFALIIAEAQHDDAVAGALDTFRAERAADLLAVVRRAERRGELHADADPGAITESILAHAWFHLLTRRLDADPQGLTQNVIGCWLR
jgi:AcrR family transcriptional regulator